MNKISLATQNINNSLVFYRALLNRMPDVFDGFTINYSLPGFELEIKEADERVIKKSLILPVADVDQLHTVHERIRRFKSLAKAKNDCELMGDAFGIEDPDGHQWVVGNPATDVHFEKCYLTDVINNN